MAFTGAIDEQGVNLSLAEDMMTWRFTGVDQLGAWQGLSQELRWGQSHIRVMSGQRMRYAGEQQIMYGGEEEVGDGLPRSCLGGDG